MFQWIFHIFYSKLGKPQQLGIAFHFLEFLIFKICTHRVNILKICLAWINLIRKIPGVCWSLFVGVKYSVCFVISYSVVLLIEIVVFTIINFIYYFKIIITCIQIKEKKIIDDYHSKNIDMFPFLWLHSKILFS